MEKSIINLLNNNLRVIIPDFGAFIVRQKQPKIIVFNEFLKYDDGLLIDVITKNEGIEIDVARQRITDFVAEANKILESGKPFVVKGLGVLQMDSTNKIVFTSDKDISLSGGKTMESTQAVINLDEKKPAPHKEIKPKQVKKPAPEINTETKEQEVQKSIQEEPVVIEESTNEQQIQKPKVINVSPAASESQLTTKPVKNKTNEILFWVILFLLANAIILAWFVFNNNRMATRNPRTAADSTLQNLTDSAGITAIDTSVLLHEAARFEPVKEDVAIHENIKYYIVAGCFKEEVNADELVKELKSKGFRAEKFGQIGNLYAVSYASFDDKEPAMNELSRIRLEVSPDAWMTRF
jgi:nucleoid DNA-binding protein